MLQPPLVRVPERRLMLLESREPLSSLHVPALIVKSFVAKCAPPETVRIGYSSRDMSPRYARELRREPPVRFTLAPFPMPNVDATRAVPPTWFNVPYAPT